MVRLSRDRGAEGIHVFGCGVWWHPQEVPGEPDNAPPHDGHYVIRDRAGRRHVVAYADVAANVILDSVMQGGDSTIDQALRETDAWTSVADDHI